VLISYIPILLILLISIFLAALLLSVSYLVGPRRYAEQKLTPYESGITPYGDARRRFSMRYYLIGALFILFDVEAVFLIAWAVVFRELGMIAFIEIMIFLLIIFAGYLYVWKRGVLEWE